MPRQAKAIVPGFPHHIVQRGHNRKPVVVKRRGSLWEGRYKISPVDAGAYLLARCHYVELNPLKAGMVDKPESCEWSSYSARVGSSACHWLDEPDIFRALVGIHQMRIDAYRQFVEQENG